MNLIDLLNLAIDSDVAVKVWNVQTCEEVFVGNVSECEEFVEENGNMEVVSWELGFENNEEFICFNVEA